MSLLQIVLLCPLHPQLSSPTTHPVTTTAVHLCDVLSTSCKYFLYVLVNFPPAPLNCNLYEGRRPVLCTQTSLSPGSYWLLGNTSWTKWMFSRYYASRPEEQNRNLGLFIYLGVMGWKVACEAMDLGVFVQRICRMARDKNLNVVTTI